MRCRRGAVGRRLAFRQNARQLIEARVLVALAGRAAVPLPNAKHSLERGIRNADRAHHLRFRLDDIPNTTEPSQQRLRRDRRAEHLAIAEMECCAIPGRNLLRRWRGPRIADQELSYGAHRKDGALAVRVDASQLRLEDGQLERELRGLDVEHLSVHEADHHRSHGLQTLREVVTARS